MVYRMIEEIKIYPFHFTVGEHAISVVFHLVISDCHTFSTKRDILKIDLIVIYTCVL